MQVAKEEKRCQIWTLKQAGLTNKEITNQTGSSTRTIQKICKRVRETNSFKDRPKTGRPQKLSPRNQRLALKILKKKQATTAEGVSRVLGEEHNINVSRKTIARAFNRHGFVSRIKKKKPKLTEKHKKARLDWAKKHESWTAEEWSQVVWSDESKFNVLNSDGKEYFWTDHPEILTENSITHTLKFGGGGVNVWSCITWQGFGFSCKIDETLDAELYSNILKEELMQTLEYYNLDINTTIFQQDNDPKHTSNLAKQTLRDLKLKVMEWPSQSPDLNPIEHFWNHVARELKRSGKLFSTKDQLWESLQKILEEKNKELCRKLIGTMSRRVLDVIKAKGGPTKW
jgi:transposase